MFDEKQKDIITAGLDALIRGMRADLLTLRNRTSVLPNTPLEVVGRMETVLLHAITETEATCRAIKAALGQDNPDEPLDLRGMERPRGLRAM